MTYGEKPSGPGGSGGREAGSGTTFGGEVTTRNGGALARISQSLTELAKLTDLLRSLVDGRMAPRLTVTGWHKGVLRVTLDEPGLATRWRFQEPALRRRLARDLPGLQEIRLVPVAPVRPASRATAPSRLDRAPLRALEELAGTETHERLRAALARLAEAAARARQEN